MVWKGREVGELICQAVLRKRKDTASSFRRAERSSKTSLGSYMIQIQMVLVMHAIYKSILLWRIHTTRNECQFFVRSSQSNVILELRGWLAEWSTSSSAPRNIEIRFLPWWFYLFFSMTDWPDPFFFRSFPFCCSPRCVFSRLKVKLRLKLKLDWTELNWLFMANRPKCRDRGMQGFV